MSNGEVLGIVGGITAAIIAVIVVGGFLFRKSEGFRGFLGLIFKTAGLIFLMGLIDEYTNIGEKYTFWVLAVFVVLTIINIVKWIKMIRNDVVDIKHSVEIYQFKKGIVKRGKIRRELEKQEAERAVKEFEENQYKMR